MGTVAFLMALLYAGLLAGGVLSGVGQKMRAPRRDPVLPGSDTEQT